MTTRQAAREWAQIRISGTLTKGFYKVGNLGPQMSTEKQMDDFTFAAPAILPDGNGGFTHYHDLMTEDELVQFLRIPQISNSENHHNVIEHLKRYRSLPRIRICNKVL